MSAYYTLTNSLYYINCIKTVNKGTILARTWRICDQKKRSPPPNINANQKNIHQPLKQNQKNDRLPPRTRSENVQPTHPPLGKLLPLPVTNGLSLWPLLNKGLYFQGQISLGKKLLCLVPRKPPFWKQQKNMV